MHQQLCKQDVTSEECQGSYWASERGGLSVVPSIMAELVKACSCCLRLKYSQEEIDQFYRSKRIDRSIEKDKHAYRRQIKLLLLGAGESGKSTFLKQMRIIHGQNFEEETRLEYRNVIYQNIIKGMKVLVDAREKLNIPWQNAANKMHSDFVQNVQVTSTTVDSYLFAQFASSVKHLWMDNSIRTAFNRRREFQLVSIIIMIGLFILASSLG